MLWPLLKAVAVAALCCGVAGVAGAMRIDSRQTAFP